MVYWITGRANSGKTTYANYLKKYFDSQNIKTILLDSDDIRYCYPTGFTNKERHSHILSIARLASLFEQQGFVVIVAIVSPVKKWRMEARKSFQETLLIYMTGGTLWKNTMYEEPDTEEMLYRGRSYDNIT